MPGAGGGGLGVFGGAGFEEIGVLHARQEGLQPGQGVFLDAIDLRQVQLAQAPVGDEADVLFDVVRRHAVDRAHLEGEVDEAVLHLDHGLAAVDDVGGDLWRDGPGLLVEGMVQFDDAFAVQAFVAHRPADDLAHALHLVLAREIHQHREGSEQLKPLREAAEHGQGAGDVAVGLDPEFAHEVMLVAHGLVFHEGSELALGHADGFEQQGVGGDVDGLHVGEGRQHHLDLGRFEHPTVFFHVVVLDLDVGLGEETEDLGQQIAFGRGQVDRPVLHVLAQRHLFGHPVDLLLLLPHVESPRIAERLVGGRRGQQSGRGRLDRDVRVHRVRGSEEYPGLRHQYAGGRPRRQANLRLYCDYFFQDRYIW